jgi:hypothetical protein
VKTHNLKFLTQGKPITADFTGVKLGEVMTDSKDIYIQYKSEGKPGEVQLRNFSKSTSYIIMARRN